MDEHELLERVATLKAQQQESCEAAARGDITRAKELADLADLEGAIDQTWDLVRQRRALEEFGRDANSATSRPVDQVENYQQ